MRAKMCLQGRHASRIFGLAQLKEQRYTVSNGRWRKTFLKSWLINKSVCIPKMKWKLKNAPYESFFKRERSSTSDHASRQGFVLGFCNVCYAYCAQKDVNESFYKLHAYTFFQTLALYAIACTMYKYASAQCVHFSRECNAYSGLWLTAGNLQSFLIKSLYQLAK